MSNAVGKLELAVACKSIQDQCKILVPFNITGTFKKFVQDAADNISRRRNEPCNGDLIGQFACNQSFVMGEIDIDLDEQRCACGCGRTCYRRRGTGCEGRCSRGSERRCGGNGGCVSFSGC